MATQKRRERYRAVVREETLAAARDLLREEGYEGLSLRKLAKRMECSPMALYSYFADKQALLTALAEEGFQKLAAGFGSPSRRDPLASLRKMMMDYIAYAEENPFEYRNLFLPVERLAEVKPTRQELQEANPAFGMLFRYTEACIAAGLFEGDAFAVSTVLWTGIHGAATILITQLNFPFGSRKRYAEEVVATLLAGAQNRPIKQI